MTDSINTIVDNAFAAATHATHAYIQAHGHTPYCGFAWVDVRPGNSKIANYLKKHHGARKSYKGGITVWAPGGGFSQSMDVNEQGAYAFASVLQDAGFDANADSRAD